MFILNLLPNLSFGNIVLFLILIVIGIIAILILKAIVSFILPIVATLIVWFLTHSLLYAGIAFVFIAILQLILKKK